MTNAERDLLLLAYKALAAVQQFHDAARRIARDDLSVPAFSCGTQLLDLVARLATTDRPSVDEVTS